MKHLKSIHEGIIPITAAFSGSSVGLDSAKVYKATDFIKFNKEVIQKCGKLKKKYKDQDALAYFEEQVENSPILVIDLDSSKKMIINYHPETDNYKVSIEPCGWGSGWG